MSRAEHGQLTPASSPPRFSPGRVLSAVGLVLVAAGTFVAIWLFPTPPRPTPVVTQVTPERLRELKRNAERQAAQERAGQEREGGEK